MKSKFVNIIFLLIPLAISNCSQKIPTVKAQYIEHQNQREVSSLYQPSLDSTAIIDFSKGVELLQQNKLDSARTFFKKILINHTTVWQAYYFLGLINTQQRHFNQAQDYLYQCFKYIPYIKKTRALLYLALAENFEDQGAYGQAKLNYITALNLDSLSARAQIGLKRLNILSQVK